MNIPYPFPIHTSGTVTISAPPAPDIILVFDPDKLCEFKTNAKWDTLLAGPESQRWLADQANRVRKEFGLEYR